VPPIEVWRGILKNRKHINNIIGGYFKYRPSGEGIYIGLIDTVEMDDSSDSLIITTLWTAYDPTGHGVYKGKKTDKTSTTFAFDILAGPDPKVERECISWEGRNQRNKTFRLEFIYKGAKKLGSELAPLAGL
jgi:hypothetical protein